MKKDVEKIEKDIGAIQGMKTDVEKVKKDVGAIQNDIKQILNKI